MFQCDSLKRRCTHCLDSKLIIVCAFSEQTADNCQGPRFCRLRMKLRTRNAYVYIVALKMRNRIRVKRMYSLNLKFDPVKVIPTEDMFYIAALRCLCRTTFSSFRRSGNQSTFGFGFGFCAEETPTLRAKAFRAWMSRPATGSRLGV